MTELFSLPKARPLTTAGKVRPGAKLTFTLVGSATEAAIFSDVDCTTEHTNPVVADANGEFAAIYLNAPRDAYLTTSTNTPVWGPITVGSAGNGTVHASDYGVTADGVTDDTTAALAAIAAVADTGRTVMFPGGTVLLTSQIAIHQCKVIGDNTKLKFSGLSASTDCIVLQGSRADFPLEFRGFHVDCNSTGRDAIVMAGGKTGDTQADFLRIDQVYVSGCVRDGLHIEPSAANHWIEDFHISNMRIYNVGRHGICIVQPNLSTTFINQGLFLNVEVRGSGQTVANGHEVYVEGQGTVSGQKVSEITWINCEFDAAGAPNHGLSSNYLTETGSVSDFDGWQWIGCVFEDVGDTIVGKTHAIFISSGTTVRNPQVIGGVLAYFPSVLDPTRVTGGARVSMSSSNINMEYYGTDTLIRWANSNETLGYESAGQVKTDGTFRAQYGFRQGRHVLTNVAGAITVAKGHNKLNLTANVTSITFPTGTGATLDGQRLLIQFTQDGTGGRTVAGWPADVLLSGGSFTPTSTASKTSLIEFVYEQGEAKWYEVSRSLNI